MSDGSDCIRRASKQAAMAAVLDSVYCVANPAYHATISNLFLSPNIVSLVELAKTNYFNLFMTKEHEPNFSMTKLKIVFNECFFKKLRIELTKCFEAFSA